jgi:hypothetical protein
VGILIFFDKNWVHVFKIQKTHESRYLKMKKEKKPLSSNFLKIEYDEYELGANV